MPHAHVLIVDDEKNILTSLSRALKIEGYAADVAGNATIALEKASKTAYDVLLLDVQMPDMTGIEMLAKLREIRALQINVESKFLSVSTEWFERIGIDLDLYFNTNNDMYDQARAVDPLFQLSDFFFDDGTLKDPVIFGGLTEFDPNGVRGGRRG